MKKSFVAIVIGLCCFLGMRAEGVVILAHDDFEGGSAGYANSGFSSVGVTSADGTVRTGTYALDVKTKKSTNEGYAKRSTKLGYIKNTYVHIISWVKADAAYQMYWKGYSSGTKVTLGGDDAWHRLAWGTDGYHYTSSDGNKDHYFYAKQNNEADKHIYVDDIIIYYSTEAHTDIDKPSAAKNVVPCPTAIKWTPGKDTIVADGQTGVAKTYILRSIDGTSTGLVLNDQGSYSVGGEDESGKFVIVAELAPDVKRYDGTFTTGDVYAIVHRDMVFNYSAPTYCTIPAMCLPEPTFTWTSENPLNVGAIYPISVTSDAGTPTLTLVGAPISGIEFTASGNSGTVKIYPSFTGSSLKFKAVTAASASYQVGEEIYEVPVHACLVEGTNIVAAKSACINAGSSKPKYYQNEDGVGRFSKEYGTSSCNGNGGTYNEFGQNFSYYVSAQEFLCTPYVDNVAKIRIYAIGNKDTGTKVNGVYWSDKYISSKSKATDITSSCATEYGDPIGLPRNEEGYVDIIFPTALKSMDYVYITFDQSSTKVYAIDYITTGGSLTASIAWTTDPGSTKVVTEGDEGFTYTAAQTGAIQSLGAISYISSDPEVASVNATTGEVTIKDNGSTIISAVLSASGCYKEMSISYHLKVQECKDDPCIISSPKTQKCQSEPVMLKVEDCEESATIQWYKDGVVLPGETGMTLTTSEAGEYKAVATKNCHQHSNTITLSDLTAAATITAKFDYYYIKNNLSSFHSINIPLFEVANADGISANFDVTDINCSLVLEDGKVYLRGQPTITSNSTITFTVTATNSCNSTNANASMELRLLAATAKPTAAWVVVGPEGGDFTSVYTLWDGDSQDTYSQHTGNAIFDYLNGAGGYSLTAVNDYATTNEKLIEQYYSQFDIVVMTDFPNSKEKDGSGNSYTNAIGSLIDKKPMLSMEAFVSAQPNWRISSDPYNPPSDQHRMKLLCAAHQIFNPAIDIGVYNDGGDEYVEVITSSTLQGFSPVSIPDFLFIATIDGGSLGELITCCERQTVIQSRFMILGIQFKGMNSIVDQAKRMVKQTLDYLLIADPAAVSDCSLVFDNGRDGAEPGSGDNKWSNPNNWGPSHGTMIPSAYHAVRIERPCLVDIPDAHASSARIAKGSYLASTYNGSIEVLPEGALSLTGFMKRTYNNDFLTRHPLQEGDITIHADASNSGALIWGDASGNVPATVDMYSKATGASTSNPVWQYIGSPFASRMTAIEQYYEAWMCRWSYISNPELGGTWTWVENEDRIDPFVGYTITQTAAKTYTWTGTLNAPEEKVLTLRYTADAEGFAMLANSWVAPINIGAMEAGDFDGADPTIYIFNSGTYGQYETGGTSAGDATVTDKTGAGQYTAVPVNAASYVGMSTIPPMQGFFVQTTRNGNLTLDYKKIVMDTINFESTTTPMRTPQRAAEEEPTGKIIPEVMQLNIVSENWGDKAFLLAHSEFSDAYELGWEGRKQEGDVRAPYLAVDVPAGAMSVAAVSDFEERELIFRAGEDSVYTFHFDYSGETIYLYDMLTEEATEIKTGNTYSFAAENKTPAPRFLITKNPPRTPTAIEQSVVSGQHPEVQKMIIDGQLYILHDRRFYDARGTQVLMPNRKEAVQ